MGPNQQLERHIAICSHHEPRKVTQKQCVVMCRASRPQKALTQRVPSGRSAFFLQKLLPDPVAARMEHMSDRQNKTQKN